MPEEMQQSGPAPERIADRYVVLGVLGRGGMAEVYRVRDELAGAEVALKRVHVREPERRRRAIPLFEREYYTLAQLAHPSVIRVYDYGVDAGGAYYTMELLEGSDVFALGQRPWREACRLLRDVASALAVLHSRRWLHRDLSPRNVFRTREGRAKLLDFGAMVPMGVARALVGTPPLVPPEAVQQLSLDARADLYSLGALGYFLLTGRHAFPARAFDDLRDLWRTVVRPPDRLAPETPAALSVLVQELLSLDRFARPASAAAVIERLDGLLGGSGEAPADRTAAARAFLSTPKLTGRDQELLRIRKRMVKSLRGRGCVILIEGERGSGRSRLLDACVLEARLLGATVLRADASDASAGDYSAVGVLGDQLVGFLPALAREVARVRRLLLASVIKSLAPERAPEVEPSALERRHLQTAVRDWFRAIARGKRVVVAVDDLELIDEPSLAVLAALAHKCERRRLVLVATVEREAVGFPALSLLRDLAHRIELDALSAAQTEALLSSLFGRVQNVAPVAQRVFELSEGNPRQIMALVDELVEHGLARYAAGGWVLTARLGAGDLPPSVDAALAPRIAALDGASRGLAQALALTEPLSLPLSAYSTLCDEAEGAPPFETLDVLVDRGILVAQGERYRFAHSRWQQVLLRDLPKERRRELHARLARALSDTSDVVARARHLMESAQERAAIELLLSERRDARVAYTDATARLLTRAVEAAERLQLPRASRLSLGIWSLEASAALGQLDAFTRFADETLSALRDDSGLSDYAALDESLEPEQRLRSALAAAQQRYDACAEHERGLPPLQAIERLASVALSFNTVSASALDPSLVEKVPSLAPLAPLLPLLTLVDDALAACRDHLAGRFARARAVFMDILTRLDGSEAALLSDEAMERARLDASYAVGMLEAMMGRQCALERVVELEGRPGYRVNAWRVRMVYHASFGDLEEAARCERRAELFLLQDGVRPFPATDMEAEATARAMSDDLDGLKQMLGRLEQASQQFPARRVIHELARCHFLRLKGDAGRALAQLTPLLREHTPERAVRFGWLGATHLMLLNALERYDEAMSAGRHYLQVSRDRGLELIDCAAFARPLAEALAQSGELDEATSLADALIEEHERDGTNGLVLGSSYETRARIALAARDAEAFNRWSDRCTVEYGRTHNPALGAKISQLLRDAQALHVLEPAATSEVSLEERAPASRSLEGTVLSLMAECVDRTERARCALTLLLEESGAREGHLYGWLGGQLTHLSSLPDSAPPGELVALIDEVVEAELRAGDITAAGGTVSQPPALRPGPALQLTPVVLYTHGEGEPIIAGAAALQLAPGAPRPSHRLLATLAESLLEHDDVDALIRLL